MPVELKRGAFSKQEQEFLNNNAAGMTAEQLASHLKRTPETIRNWIRKNAVTKGLEEYHPTVLEKKEVKAGLIRKELRESQAWKQLKEEMIDHELKYFEERFIALKDQFAENILASEEMQIMLAIKLEVLMHRNLVARQRSVEDIKRLEAWLTSKLRSCNGKPEELDEEQQKFILNLTNQLSGARSADQSKTKEFVELQSKHSSLMKELKATRDQRMTRATESTQSYVGLLKSLQEEDIREREGKHNELMKMATEKEWDRMAKPVKYLDGNMDSPILCADTIERLEKMVPDNPGVWKGPNPDDILQ